MPHLTLEYTANITQEIDSRELFSELHQVLGEIGGICIENCKSRARSLNLYHIAKGATESAFIHLEIRLFEGRPPTLKAAIGDNCLHILENYFAESISQLDLQITVEICDMQKPNYFKFSKGTLTTSQTR